MKSEEIIVGFEYLARVNGKTRRVRVLDIIRGVRRGQRTNYNCKNLDTGREVFFRSSQKFLKKVVDEPRQMNDATPVQ